MASAVAKVTMLILAYCRRINGGGAFIIRVVKDNNLTLRRGMTCFVNAHAVRNFIGLVSTHRGLDSSQNAVRNDGAAKIMSGYHVWLDNYTLCAANLRQRQKNPLSAAYNLASQTNRACV